MIKGIMFIMALRAGESSKASSVTAVSTIIRRGGKMTTQMAPVIDMAADLCLASFLERRFWPSVNGKLRWSPNAVKPPRDGGPEGEKGF